MTERDKTAPSYELGALAFVSFFQGLVKSLRSFTYRYVGMWMTVFHDGGLIVIRLNLTRSNIRKI